eukprot:6156839-Amphidinium_carterae.1
MASQSCKDVVLRRMLCVGSTKVFAAPLGYEDFPVLSRLPQYAAREGVMFIGEHAAHIYHPTAFNYQP